MANRWGNSGNSDFIFWGIQNHCRWWLQPWNLKTLAPWKKSWDKPTQHITLPTKVCLVKAIFFPVVMYGCESWTIKKAECRRTDAFELWCWRRLLRVPWTAKRSNPVHLQGDQSWVFIGRTDADAETPILWSHDVKNWLIRKDSDAGDNWRQEGKWMTDDKMVG